jgi:hypothetical protein
MTAQCRCCERRVPKQGPRLCPECGHVFQGNGWDGIDAHWHSKHEKVMPYRDFWRSLCDAHRGRRPMATKSKNEGEK